MPKIKYQDKNFRGATLALIQTSEGIIKEYAGQGFRLTLRQLYYQLVSRDVIANKQTEYDRLGSIINDARLAGLIDWSAIEDRTRNVEINSHWDHPSDVIVSASKSYRNDLWANQPVRCEVWVEKDALEGVVESACRPMDVPFFSCRGYTSQTAMWEAGMRLLRYRQAEVKNLKVGIGKTKRQKVVIFHLGDHDPSGIDMTRDIRDRLELFTGQSVEIRRIALNMDQVEQYQPPPNPAKQTDSRFQGYMEIHGDESWELDALTPTVLVALIRKHIKSVRDEFRWQDALMEQETGRAELNAISGNYEVVADAVEEFVVQPTLEDDEDPEDEDDEDPEDEDDQDPDEEEQ